MSIGHTTRIERAILSVLSQPAADGTPSLTGERSAGSVVIRATGPDVVLKPGRYAKAVITSAGGNPSVDPRLLVKTVEERTVTAAGVEVPIVSMLGGANTNLPVGTVLRWDPVIAGVEPASTLTAPMTGGLAATAYGTVKRALSFEGIGQGEVAKQFWAAQAPGLFPAIVVSWESAGPARSTGHGRQIQLHRYRLYVIVSRLENDEERRHEGKAIMDRAAERLCDRAAADGESFSNPPIVLGAAGRLAASPTSYVYWMDFEVSYSTLKRELRSFADWSTSRERLQTPPSEAYPLGQEITQVDQTQNMT